MEISSPNQSLCARESPLSFQPETHTHTHTLLAQPLYIEVFSDSMDFKKLYYLYFLELQLIQGGTILCIGKDAIYQC